MPINLTNLLEVLPEKFEGLFGGPSNSDSITNKTVKVISDLHARKKSVKYKILQGHKFGGVLLKEFTYCSRCSGLIWGIVGQRCKLCKLVSHKRCLDSIIPACQAERASSNGTDQFGTQLHQFKRTQFMRFTYCKHCGCLIKGIFNQGHQCTAEGCVMTVHDECMELACDISCPRVEPISITTGRKDDIENENNEQFSSRTNIDDFDLIRVIGTGSYGKVYLARQKSNQDREFAIKVVKKTQRVVSSDPESTLTEMEVLKIGRSYQFLTTAHCCFQSRDRLFFVMEYVNGRDLLYHIEKSRKFTEKRTRFYSAEIVLALRYLHRHGIIHRDLKLEHVMLDKRGHCKLLDFGMAKDLRGHEGGTTRTFCGTPNYMSPEVCKRSEYGTSVDWWALGVLMFAMLLGEFPFDDDDEEEERIYNKIMYENVKFPPSDSDEALSDEARSILEGLLTKDPNERLGCKILENYEKEILVHPFYRYEADKSPTWWDDMAAQRIPPPYQPTTKDLEQPDTSDRNQEPISVHLTPIASKEVKKINQSDFIGFSFRSESFNSELVIY